jgi:sigma-B regulation protein RsbU (phosphoserine phosphatase)
MTDRPQGSHTAFERSLFGSHPAEQELLDLARTQRQILNQVPPQIPGYEQVLAYRPAYFATGDYHDFFTWPHGQAIFVGDGSGHGPTASILMVTMRTILHTHPAIHTDPGATLAAACRMFHRLIPSDRFMTAVYLLLGDDGKTIWASAGHHPPILLRRPDAIEPLNKDVIGLPLAPWPDENYENVGWELQPGDRMMLFTDGLVESRNKDGVQLGRTFLEEHIRETKALPLQQAIDQLLERVNHHLEGAEFEDDFTIVAVERR